MKLSHLKIQSNTVPKYVLMPSDPNKVDLIGKNLKNFKILGQNREFRTGIGSYKGVKIMICSTGIGCPSVAIATEELIDAGATTLIRVGTCGGAWKKNIPLGSYIIPTASVRDEGTTLEYIPQGFPAVADFEIVGLLKKYSEKNNKNTFVGLNRTHDAFYGSLDSIKKWGSYLRDEKWKKYKTPILSSEMECSALFIISQLRNVRAGAILLANASPEPLKDRIYERKQTVVTESDEISTYDLISRMSMVVLIAISEDSKKLLS